MSGKKKSAPLPPKKAVVVDPKAKAILEMKAKQEALRNRLLVIAKVKQLEAKRKAEIDQSALAIAQLAKNLPPVDSKKFLGLPGPPPFAPKAKAKPPADDSGLPSAIAPPKIEEDDQEEQPDEELPLEDEG